MRVWGRSCRQSPHGHRETPHLLRHRSQRGRGARSRRLSDIAEATLYPFPAGSGLLQDLDFLAFTLPQIKILMPTKQPRSQELTREQHAANQTLHHRRRRIEHVHIRVKRGRPVADRMRLRKEGIRDRVMGLCCALHTFRVRLIPWPPMALSGYTHASIEARMPPPAR